MQLHGALINGLEMRVSEIEGQLSDLDARGSEEHDNLANERELHRFILTGESDNQCFLTSFKQNFHWYIKFLFWLFTINDT